MAFSYKTLFVHKIAECTVSCANNTYVGCAASCTVISSCDAPSYDLVGFERILRDAEKAEIEELQRVLKRMHELLEEAKAKETTHAKEAAHARSGT